MLIHIGNESTQVTPSDDSYRYRTLMGEDAITLIFQHWQHIDIPIGSYVDYQGERYTLNSPQNLRKNSTRSFEYTLILEAPKGALTKYRFKDTNTNRLKFSLTAKPSEFLQAIVDNLNQRESGWIAGASIEGREKTLTFSHNSISEALQMAAEAFETEYEINGKTISLKRVEYNKEAPLPLSYGMGNGFLSGVRRENRDITTRAIERLYVQGGSRNIDPSKYGAAELLLPKSQSLTVDGKTYEVDADGYSIARSDKAMLTGEEGSLDCAEIFPNREGEITTVITVDQEKHFYDFTDNTIPEALDYSNTRIDGERATVIFQTGQLAGREFDLEQTDKVLTGYIHAERRFKIVPQEIDGQTMPNETFKPAIGDKYRIFNIHLPEAYIRDDQSKTGASWDMFRKAVEYMAEHEVPQFTFTGELDPIWAKTNWLNIGGKILIGGFVSFTDSQFQSEAALVRITGIKDYINRPYSPEIELSNAPVGVSILSYLGKIETSEVVIDASKKDSIQYTKRSYRDTRETMQMLAESFLNFTGSISPVTLQTMQALIGDESLQYRFVNSATEPVQIDPMIEYDSQTKELTIPSGRFIQHMTLGISEIKNQHAVSDFKIWEMEEYTSAPLTQSDKSYFLYAKVSKTAPEGEFILSEQSISMEEIPGYYHLLTAIINSEYQGERSIAALYGFTEILPGRITTEKIVSSDGKTVVDLVNSIIKGNISFLSGEEYKDAKTEIESTNYLKSAIQNTTQILGGLLLSEMIAIKNSNGDVVGGMNGKSTEGNDIRIWFGKAIAQMQNAPFRVYENGQVEITNEYEMMRVKLLQSLLPELSEISEAVKIDIPFTGTAPISNSWNPNMGDFPSANPVFDINISGNTSTFTIAAKAQVLMHVETGSTFQHINGTPAYDSYCRLINTETNEVVIQGESQGNGVSVIDGEYFLPAGSYKIEAHASLTVADFTGHTDPAATCGVYITWGTGDVNYYTHATKDTIVAVDGISSFNSIRGLYFYLSTSANYLLQTKGDAVLYDSTKTYGLKISADGIQKSSNGGTTWVNL